MQLKCMCLNLWYGGKLWDPLLRFLNQERPDILAAQEVYDGHNPALPARYQTVERFRAELGYPYVFFSPAYGDVTPHGVVELGNAIFSRFPMTEERTVFYDVPYKSERDEERERPDFTRTPRNLQHAVFDLKDDSPLHVLNTQGIWGFDAEDNPRRSEMSNTILREIGQHTPVVLCGDFNVGENTETIRKIEQRLTNVFRGKLHTTFNRKHKPETFVGAVVDMIFVSPNISVEKSFVSDADVTDHVPLVCEIRIAKRGARSDG